MKTLARTIDHSLVLLFGLTGIILCTTIVKLSLQNRSVRRIAFLKYILIRPRKVLHIVSSKTPGLPSIPEDVRSLLSNPTARIFHLASTRYIFISDIYMHLRSILVRDFSFRVSDYAFYNIHRIEFSFNYRYYPSKHPVHVIVLYKKNEEGGSLFTVIALEK